jgi:uncharacterized protein YjiK
MIIKKITYSIILLSGLSFFTACGSGVASPENDEAMIQGNPNENITSSHTIANINEASGICYSSTQDLLFAVSDKGILYKLHTDGTILKEQSYKTSKGKKYDFEGVACDDAHGNLIVAVEGKDNVMTINQNTFEKTPDIGDIERPADNTLYKDKDGKNGIEGITIQDDVVYISNQSNTPYPGKDASFIFTIDSYSAPHPTIQNIYDPKLTDIAGLDFYHDSLYMVHSKNLLSAYNIQTKKILKTIQLPNGIQAEGVAFDNSGNIYFAYDGKTDGKIYKYSLAEIGIE